MKFIRSYWGDLENFGQRHRNEIEFCSNDKRLDQIIIVWGDDNERFIKSLGFETVLMSSRNTEYGDDYLYDSDIYMIHKFAAVRKGIELYGEVVFLDWDCMQIKDIDNNFYKQLRKSGSKIQMPLYSFPKNYSELVLNEWIDIPPKEKEYVLKQQSVLDHYHYLLGPDYITPNASFIYCNDALIMDELIRINQDLKVGTPADETMFLVYSKAKCSSIDDYIQRYEPIVCDAKGESHFNQKELNKYISLFIKKDLYFIHQ